MKKVVGSGVGSGSIRGTDTHQNVTDPQHWSKAYSILYFFKGKCAGLPLLPCGLYAT